MLNGKDKTAVIRERLAAKKTVLGCSITQPSIAMAEIIALAGFHFTWIETEHTTLSLHEVETLILASENAGSAPIVRVRNNNENEIGQALDMGAGGVIVPHVDTVGDALKAVGGAKYYPTGRRGFASTTRSTAQGWKPLTTSRMTALNSSTLLVVQIESLEAVKNADAIAAVEGVDMLFVGYADLCQDMGIDPDPTHPDCAAAIETVGNAIRNHGKYGAMITGDPATAALYHELGFDCILAGMDIRLFADNARSIISKFSLTQ